MTHDTTKSLGADQPRWRCRRCGRDEIDARANGCKHGPCPMDFFSLQEGTAEPPFLSPPQKGDEPRPGVDRAAVERLRRFVEGETARTIYKLPPNGRFDPMRADLRAILAALPESGDLHAE